MASGDAGSGVNWRDKLQIPNPMSEGGKLTLSTTRVEVDNSSRTRHPEAQIGPYICLAVKDTGCGMDSATVDRIFEPFFTTKDPGRGTGMGLATVYGVLKQHGGWVEVDTAPGRGTTIRTFFPLSADGLVVPPDKLESPATESMPINAITILVVEDEEMLREFVSDALVTIGYRVLSAANGKEALGVWAKHKEEIDLLLTDVVMFVPEFRRKHESATCFPDVVVIEAGNNESSGAKS